jgi:hypothetical protein
VDTVGVTAAARVAAVKGVAREVARAVAVKEVA